LPEIICNTSPLQYLYQLGAIELLHTLAGRITVPSAVVDELETGRNLGINLPDVSAFEWVTIRHPAGTPALPLVSELGSGETEVLMLALELTGAVVILDDGLARYVAETIGIKLTGTLGILRDAKRAGLIPEVGPLLDRLEELGFRLAPQTKIAILRQAGEMI
jgi:predicted nucleic acid-binding protein